MHQITTWSLNVWKHQKYERYRTLKPDCCFPSIFRVLSLKTFRWRVEDGGWRSAQPPVAAPLLPADSVKITLSQSMLTPPLKNP